MTDAAMNCDCESESPYRAISALKRDMMIGLGYAAQADNPPPGMADEMLYYLQRAQKHLILKNPDLRTLRLFKWTTVQGTRYYDLTSHDTNCGCALRPEAVQWVGWKDANGRWTELINGISPRFYTTSSQEGYPTHYEIRSCLEIFPAPSYTGWELWIKGQFKATAFANNEHKPILDDELVLLLALAMAKGKKGHKDAGDAYTQAGNYLKDFKAGLHGTRRYIPGEIAAAPAVQPTMDSFDG